MPFGEHKGKRYEDVPIAYLVRIRYARWLRSWPDLYRWIQRNWTKIQEAADDVNHQADFFLDDDDDQSS